MLAQESCSGSSKIEILVQFRSVFFSTNISWLLLEEKEDGERLGLASDPPSAGLDDELMRSAYLVQ
jgi:hypothetical protein